MRSQRTALQQQHTEAYQNYMAEEDPPLGGLQGSQQYRSMRPPRRFWGIRPSFFTPGMILIIPGFEVITGK